MSGILPYFHPTSVLIVDDDATFLDSFCFRYDELMLCEPETSVERALERLREDSGQTSVAEMVSSVETPSDSVEGDCTLRLRPSQIASIMHDAQRFAQISVVIVDYAMPRMTGVDFCRHLRGQAVKKVLLTGKTGESTAVAAFNEGLIDLFLVKQDSDLPRKIVSEVARLQHAYFAQRTAALDPMVSFEDHGFLADPAFARWFAEFRQRHTIVEHYVTSSPPGLLLIDAEGHTTKLVISGEERMRAQLETAQEAEAPAELIRRLQSKTAILACPTMGGYYQPEHQRDWPKYLLAATPVHGEVLWRVAQQVGGETSRIVPLAQFRRSCRRASA